MTCRMTKLSSFSWIKQPDSNGGLTFDTVRSFSASGAGSTTTVVSTGLGASSDSNDDFVGWIVECTDATNTQNEGLRRRILEVNDSTNTFTTDAWPAATSSGDQFQIMKPPIALCVARSASSSTNGYIGARDRDETNGYWSDAAQEGGPYVIVVAADNASSTNHLRVTTNTSQNRHISLATNLSGGVVVGDYFELWKHPENINSGMLELSQELVERNPVSGSFGKFASVGGNRSGTGTVELAFRGPGTGRAGSHSEAHEVLSCVLDHTDSGGDSTVDSGSSTTSVAYSAGNHSVGDLGLTDTGYACIVTADSGSAYTVSPAVDTAPSSGDTFYGMTTYSPSDCINAALSICQYRAKDILEYAYGCVPTLSFNAARGDFLKISCGFQVADWVRVGASGTALSRAWKPKLPTVDPIKLASGRVRLDGTSFNIRSFAFDLGLDIQQRVNITSPNDTDGFELVGDAPTGTIEVYNGSNERKALDDFMAGKEIEMIAQFGTTAGFPGVFVVWAYRIRYTGAAIGDESGQVTLSLPFEVIYDPTSSLERYSIGIC